MKRIPTKFIGVYQRESGKRKHNGKPDICFDITYKVDGKKVWEKAGWVSEGYSAKLADLVRAEHIRCIRHGEELPQEKKKAPIFKEVAAKYVTWAKENKKSGKDDESRYTHHLGPEFDNKRLDAIFPLDIERFKSKVAKGGRVTRKDDKGRKVEREPGLSPQTIKHCLALIRQIYNKAIDDGLYDGVNPVKKKILPKVDNDRKRFLTYEEAGTLLKTLKSKSEDLHDIALISLHCGLRAGEIFKLKGQDINLSHGFISIVHPKNSKSRKADMTKSTRQIFEKRKPESPNEYVFKDKRHQGKIKQISHVFIKTVNDLGLNKGITDREQKVVFHTLRHTFASWLALQGRSLLMIADLLGDKLEQVQRYAHLLPGEKQQALLSLEDIFDRNCNGFEEQITDSNIAG